MRNPSRTLPIAALLFFCSGALGLGYELVWIRKAALVVGASQIALSTVLTSFFLGLALGSYFFARYPRGRRRSPLVIYGALELAIGAYALAFPLLFDLLQAVYGTAYPVFAGSTTGLFGLRFFLLFLLFLVPTFFMGGTLPLLLDGLVASDKSIGPRTSVLYGINILGAVVGVLLTGYFAMPYLGMNLTSVAGGLGNLAIGAIAVVAFRGLSPIHGQPAIERLDPFFPAAAFVSGLLAIAYQIAWARYFTLFNFSTVYLTAMLLAVFLLALATGSFILAPLLHARFRPLAVVGFCQALVPVAVALSVKAWRLAEYRFVMQMEPGDAGLPRPSLTFELDHDSPEFWHFISETADALFFAPLFQTALVVFPTVVLIGTALPALIAAGAQRSSGLRGVSGRLVFWNTVGSSAGGFLCGYALLPLVGLHRTLFALGLGSLGLSLAALIKSSRRTAGAGGAWSYAVPGVGLAALLAFLILPEDITRQTIRQEQFPTVGAVTTAEAGRDSSRLEFKEVIEGPLTTAYVTEDETTLRIGSGFTQMGYVVKDTVNTQAIAGHLPVLFYPGRGMPRDCLGLCLGSGQSFGALLRYPIERLDVVEISGEITNLALRHFAPYNNNLGDDPRVRFHLDDGRHFIERARDASFDLISMESPPPTSDGVHSLYSVEFYRNVRRILRPGGVYMQFLPLYFVTPLDARSIIKTMSEVFPETFLLKVTFGDFVLLGYRERPTFVSAAMRSRSLVLAREWAAQSPPWGMWSPDSQHHIASFEGLSSLLITGPEFIRQMDTPLIYHDDRQLLSYSSGDRWLARRYMGIPLIHISFAELPLTDIGRLREYFDPPLSASAVETLRSEQVAALKNLNIRHPRDIGQKMRALQAAQQPVERAGFALALALDFDATLQKTDAYQFVGVALEAFRDHPDLVRQEHRDAVRKIVRNRIAVYDEVAEQWLEIFQKQFAGAALLEEMLRELKAYREREATARSLYLFR